MLARQSPMAQASSGGHSPVPARSNVGRLVQQLNTHAIPSKPAPPPPPPFPVVPLSQGRRSPPTAPTSAASEISRHVVCSSPTGSTKSSTPSPASGSPASQRRPVATDIPRRPPVSKAAARPKPKPAPLPKPRDDVAKKPRVTAKPVVVTVKKTMRRNGHRSSPKSSPQNTLEQSAASMKAHHKSSLGRDATAPQRPLPVPKPRPPGSSVPGNGDMPASFPNKADHGGAGPLEGSRNPPVLPEDVITAAARILSTEIKGLKTRPVRKRSLRKPPSQPPPRLRSSTRQQKPAPIVYEMAGTGVTLTNSESSLSSAPPDEEYSLAGMPDSSSNDSLALNAAVAAGTGPGPGPGPGTGTCCVYEAVEGATLSRAQPAERWKAADDDVWEDVEGGIPVFAGPAPSQIARFRNMAGRLLKGQDVQGSVSSRTRTPGAAIAAASAFLRQYLPGKPVGSASETEDGDAGVYSDVSGDEWAEDEDDDTYSSVQHEVPYGSVPAPPLHNPKHHLAEKPLPPIPVEDYSYATRGETGQGQVLAKEPQSRQRAKTTDPLFYCVSENTALEAEVAMAALPSSVDDNDDCLDDDDYAVAGSGEDSKPECAPSDRKHQELLLAKPRVAPVRSQSPMKDSKPAPVPKPKRKPPQPRSPPKPTGGMRPLPPARPEKKMSDVAQMEVVKPRLDHSYSEVNIRHKTPAVKTHPRPPSLDSWGNTPPPPLMERIRTVTRDRDVFMSHSPSPEPGGVHETETLTNDVDAWGNTDTFTPGQPPPRQASLSASENSLGTEFTTLLQRHRARQDAQQAMDECSEDEDELTSNAALSTICSSELSDRDSHAANTLDRVVFSCSLKDSEPVALNTRSMLAESPKVKAGRALVRQAYVNFTMPTADSKDDGVANFYQNTGQAMAAPADDDGEDDDMAGDLFDYGELPFKGADGSVAIRQGGLRPSKGTVETSPLKSVPNKPRKRSDDRLSSSFGLEEPALYQYVSDLNFQGNPLEPVHFGSLKGQFDVEEEVEEDFEDESSAIYEGLDNNTYQCLGRNAPDKQLRESVRETKKRMLWSEQAKVRNSGILASISDDDRRLQEANFEVITSEISYNRSLKILIDHFMDSPLLSPDLPADRRVLSRDSYKHLFSNIKIIYDISSKLLEALKDRESQTICVDPVCDTINEFVSQSEFFEPYVTYCKNQIYQLREMKRLQETNTRFHEVVCHLESNKICQGLPLLSFFTLPTQRITRFPLLMVAIIDRMQAEDKNYETSQQVLELTQALVRRCNEAARSMERTEQLIDLQTKIDFGKIRQLPLVSSSRWLVRSGELSLLSVEKAVIRKGARVHKQTYHLFLFNDLLILAKKKTGALGLTNETNQGFSVLDYAWRSAVEMEDLPDQATPAAPLPTPAPGGAGNSSQYAAIQPALGPQLSRQDTYDVLTVLSAAGAQNALKLVLVENAYQKSAVFLLVAESQSEKYRWLDAVNPPQPTTDGETIYGEWDCPQVKVTFPYAACQPDELTLSSGEVIKVLRKMPDGWFEGERLRDGLVGWFPSTHCKEIQNEHARLRNLRQHYHMQNASKRDKLTPIKPEKPSAKPSKSPRKFRNSLLIRLNSAGADK